MTIPWAIAISASAAACAVALLLAIRRLAPKEGFWGDREPNHSGGAIGVLGSGFAILVAFVLSLAFGGFQAARHGAQQEAEGVEQMYQDAGLLPTAVRDPVRGLVACYALAVARTDWGTNGDVAQAWPVAIAKLEQRADQGRPADVRALDELDAGERDRVEGYVAREENATPPVPAILWIAMIAGGVLLVGYLCAFARPRTRILLQVYIVAAVAAVGALNLCVIRFLDTPFSGSSGSVRPTAMEYALTHFDITSAALPCDARGRPRSGATGPS
ncbi:MAG TPA: hypothetical protein VG165_15830 [Solirubrobacteraceae bacterium]|nr:hypothetical protein [Solirubrobacteraceae bacterium]